tara:strand:+ start:1015 stop:2106 length:1092 start_codon:yes stop_codon:yes gene_type:complete
VNRTPIQLQIASPFFENTRWSHQVLQDTWQPIINWLGAGTARIFPPPIQDAGTLGKLGAVILAVRRFQNIQGFADLGIELGSDPDSGSWSTMYLALQLSKTDDCEVIEFEPSSEGNRKADIAANLLGVRHLFECKSADHNDSGRTRRHEIIDLLKPYIPDGVQIDVCFEADLSNDEWKSLAESIADRAPNASQEGAIIKNAKLEVIAQPGQDCVPERFHECRLEGFLETTSSGEVLLVSSYTAQNTRLSVAGPKLDPRPFVQKAFNASRHQRTADAPFVLVVDVTMLGVGLQATADAARTFFQPKRNTSYAGVLAVRRSAAAEGMRLESQLVGNPFARSPLATELTRHWPNVHVPARFDSPLE